MGLLVKVIIFLISAASAGCGTQCTNGLIQGPAGTSADIKAVPIPVGDARCANKAGGVQYTTYSGNAITDISFICNGANGQAGTSSSLNVAPATTAQCQLGGVQLLITSQGYTSTALVCNGLNGQNAVQSGFTIMALIQPCGVTSSSFKESLILFANGEVLSSFSESASGAETRLSALPDGSYIDTDASDCSFNINTNMSILSRSISWSGQVQKTWQVPNTFNPVEGM